MAYAETALADSTFDAAERQRSLAVLGRYVPPARLRKVETLLALRATCITLKLDTAWFRRRCICLASSFAPADRDSHHHRRGDPDAGRPGARLKFRHG